jgi:hypothetical protein
MRAGRGWACSDVYVARRRDPWVDGDTVREMCLAGLKEGCCGFSLLLTAFPRLQRRWAGRERDRCEMDEVGLISAEVAGGACATCDDEGC